MSKRLVRQLDTLQSCEDDYYKHYGDYLRANKFKPTLGWLEYGLFSGPDVAASPSKFSILSSKTDGEHRVHVRPSVTYTQMPSCVYPPSHPPYHSIVTLIL